MARENANKVHQITGNGGTFIGFHYKMLLQCETGFKSKMSQKEKSK